MESDGERETLHKFYKTLKRLKIRALEWLFDVVKVDGKEKEIV